MYGYRARIGLIVPASNTTCEHEIAALCPKGVKTYTSRIFFDPSSIDGLIDLRTGADRASRELSCEGICNLIAFCCTSGSMIGGLNSDKEIIDRIQKQSSTLAIATATAVITAFESLKVKKIGVATPYPKEVNNFIRSFLEQSGYHVTALRGVFEDLSTTEVKNIMIGGLQPEAAYEMGMKVDGKENDAIFISCTNLRSIEIIEKLERQTSKPVVSSNQATLWYALRKLGIRDAVEGYGRLLEQC